VTAALRAFFALVLLLGAYAPLRAQMSAADMGDIEGAPSETSSIKSGLLLPDAELIDLPTAAALDLGGFYSRTRFFLQGGVLEWLAFGVYPRVNIGVSAHVDRLVGNATPVQITRPELQVKIRFFDGDRLIPAFAVGYDGQGYFYNRNEKRYNHRQRGLYVVGTQEIGLPGLQAHAGMNISDFDNNGLFGMMGVSMNVQDKLKLIAEWDNINNFHDSRANMGFRVYMTPFFNFDFSVRAIGHGGWYSNGVPRDAERIVQFKYTGNF